MTQPFGRTSFGVIVWPVPGRDPGQRSGLLHLTWGGPGDAIHFHTRGLSRDGSEYPGWDTGTVSEECQDITQAQGAVDTYLTSLGLELAGAAHTRTAGIPAELLPPIPIGPADPIPGTPAPGAACGPAPWLDEILRAAGDISPDTASKIRLAAEETRQQYSFLLSEAWAQHAARNAAKMVLASVAAEGRPVVQAAFRRYQDAAEHADRLLAAADSAPGRRGAGAPDNFGTREWADAVAARREAGALLRNFRKTFMSTRAHYASEVRKAWWQADKDFLITHRAALEAADPPGFKRALGAFTEDSSPSARTSEFPDKVRPAAAARGSATTGPPLGPRGRRPAPPMGGRTP